MEKQPNLKIIYCGEEEPKGACDNYIPNDITINNTIPLIRALSKFRDAQTA